MTHVQYSRQSIDISRTAFDRSDGYSWSTRALFQGAGCPGEQFSGEHLCSSRQHCFGFSVHDILEECVIRINEYFALNISVMLGAKIAWNLAQGQTMGEG